MDARLYVSNLSYGVTEQGLRELFMQAGNVNSVALIKEPGTQRSRGFAFVEMGSPTEVQKAISMFNGYALDERLIAVNIAHPREARNAGGFQPQGSYRNNNNKRRY
jgi:RNA recognition motif-containing protein